MADVEERRTKNFFRTCTVVFASFLCNGIFIGIINNFSVIYSSLESTGAGSSSAISFVGSLAIGVMFLVSPLAGILTDRFGPKRTVFVGGTLAAVGMLLSSFLSDKVYWLYVTYGVVFGTGSSLGYTPTLAALAERSPGSLVVINGISTTGSALFSLAMPYLLEYMLSNTSIAATLKLLSLLCCVIPVSSLAFKAQKFDNNTERNGLINIDIWKNKKYSIWACSFALFSLGYFVPYVYIGSFFEKTFGSKSNVPLVCMGVFSAVGRLICGFASGWLKVDRTSLHQMAFYGLGSMYVCLPFVRQVYQLIIVSVLIGFFDGCYSVLIGPVAFDLCGEKGGPQAMGFLLGVSAIPLVIGPPIAGYIYEQTGTYTLPFVFAGVMPLIGATVMFAIRFVKKTRHDIQYSRNGIIL